MFEELYVVWHAECDSDENLTEFGIEYLGGTTAKIRDRLNGKLECVPIYHSYTKRATQTAHLIAKELVPIQCTLVERIELAPDTLRAKEVADEVTGCAIIVSHRPDIDELCRRFGFASVTTDFHRGIYNGEGIVIYPDDRIASNVENKKPKHCYTLIRNYR